MKYLYKYPQAAYPYNDLVDTSRQRSRQDPEYELLDTGIFNDDRYFDVFVEYAKAGPEDLLIKISVVNRGPEVATLQVLPTLWFRNTWSWDGGGRKPLLSRLEDTTCNVIVAHHNDPLFHQSLPDYHFYCEEHAPFLFTENESNYAKLFGGVNASPYVKDGIHNFVVHGTREAVNPAGTGTKAAAQHTLEIPSHETRVIRLRLAVDPPGKLIAPFQDFEKIVSERLNEADEFYERITPPAIRADEDRKRVLRQALAGMLWSKQYFYYDASIWLRAHHVGPDSPPKLRSRVRNAEWFHMINDDIISMPDKWEYPWYAAWDLAFHTLALASVDLDFAKSQLDLMLRNGYLHPNGQMPAYEWNFGDVNPPVHAFATMQIYLQDKRKQRRQG